MKNHLPYWKGLTDRHGQILADGPEEQVPGAARKVFACL